MLGEELIDVYDATRKHLGTKPRQQVHLDGDWHRAFHCWILAHNKRGQYCVILQRRSLDVASWRGYLDVSCGGHYRAGETTAGGLRELKEETGIDTTLERLQGLGVRVCVDEFQSGIVNHEFQDVYLLLSDRSVTNYQPQGSEVNAFVEIEIRGMIDLFTEKVERVVAECVTFDRTLGCCSGSPNTIEIGRNQFVPTLDQYVLKTMYLAQRALKGEDCLLI